MDERRRAAPRPTVPGRVSVLRGVAALGLAVVLSVGGCFGTDPPRGVTTFEDALRTFYDEWERYLVEEGRSPKHWDELIVRLREQGGETSSLQRVRNEGYEVAWGRVPADLIEDPAKVPLAEKEGMPTLYFDGHIARPSPDED